MDSGVRKLLNEMIVEVRNLSVEKLLFNWKNACLRVKNWGKILKNWKFVFVSKYVCLCVNFVTVKPRLQKNAAGELGLVWNEGKYRGAVAVNIAEGVRQGVRRSGVWEG